MDESITGEIVTQEDSCVILGLRLLIARAANRDSLAWWDDESLTEHANFLLERLFPTKPSLAARNLALRAAFARHEVIYTGNDRALHLYRLDGDNKDKLALRFVSLLPVTMPEQPVETIDALRQYLLKIAGEPATYNVLRRTNTHGLQIEIPPCPDGVSYLVHRAKTFAWAYLEGEPGKPVFPYCIE